VAASGFRLDRTLGPVVVSWIERNLVHGPGDVQGNRIQLDDEQVRFICHAYAIDPVGKRLVRRAVYSRPKGRAKSELAAFLVCAEALGPVRFAGWDHNGRPMGRPVRSPYIPMAATEEGQADNAYGPVTFILREGPISQTPGLDVGITRTYLPDGGKIAPITAKASSKDGGKETFAVFDETHLYVLPELHRLHDTIRRNLGKRKDAEPWSLETSTMYAPDEGSVAEFSHMFAKSVASGKIVDPGFLFDHRQGPTPFVVRGRKPEFDWDDDDQLRAALATAYGDAAEWMDLERLVREARDPQTDQADFCRYFLNISTKRSSSWLPADAWTSRAVTRAVEDGTKITMGFDGSYNNDSTALVGCTVEERPHIFVIGVWERPENAGRDWVVPRDEVEAAVHKAMGRYQVVELVCDPPGWDREITDWGERYGSPPVVVFEHNRRSLMAKACAGFYSGVVNETLTQDGHEALARHVGNAVTKETPDGAYITKDGRMSPRKIDLAVAAVTAYDRAIRAVEFSGPLLEVLV
jgi:phage terminase large subunit-like protein